MAQLEWEYPFEEIEAIIAERVSKIGDKLAYVEITWFDNERTYDLELHCLPVAGYFVSPGDPLPFSISRIAAISKYKDGWDHPENLDVLKKAGRDLYYRLRKKYPVKRNLGGTYRW